MRRFSFLRFLFSEFAGGKVIIAFELSGETALIGESAFGGDRAERQVGQFDPLDRFGQTQTLKVIAETDTDHLREAVNETRAA